MVEQRRSQRFDLKLPFELVRTGSQTVWRRGETKNLSSNGVLFISDAEVRIGQPIEFIITLPTGADGASVRLRCVGRVVRTELPPAKDPDAVEPREVSIAATVDRFEFVRGAGR